jgi:hypothetical protein
VNANSPRPAKDALRNEQILSLGTLAAGAAHQLGRRSDDGRGHPRT